MPDTIELPERFWSKTRRDPNGCLVWTNSTNAKGYGRFRFEGETHLAHRLVIGLRNRDEEWALHRCDNPPCVERSHLYVGDRADNARDAVERGRLFIAAGALNGKSVAETVVFDVRSRRIAGQSIRSIAAAHDVGHGWISRICNGKRWPDGPWPHRADAIRLGYLRRSGPDNREEES